MPKTILITGATDGIGLLTAKHLSAQGHHVLLHGRSPSKLDAARAEMTSNVETYLADLSDLAEVSKLADQVKQNHQHLDVLINNAGVFKTGAPLLPNGQDVRFVVNTLAPFKLTQALLERMPVDGRVINLSSAAQAPVDIRALKGEVHLSDMEAYAQSKLAITMWSHHLAQTLRDGPAVIAVNPGSFLASKMVKEGFGVAGNDLQIGADILMELALDPCHATATGKYWDNDAGKFADPHAAGLDPVRIAEVFHVVQDMM